MNSNGFNPQVYKPFGISHFQCYFHLTIITTKTVSIGIMQVDLGVCV